MTRPRQTSDDTRKQLSTKLRLYWKLIKSLQTGLLLATGVAGFMSARCPALDWRILLSMSGSLFLAISGSTVLNMWYDRDIDGKMPRTCRRPLPSGKVSRREALLLGLVLSVAGVGWAVALQPLYGLVVFAGLFIDVVIYTIWLKRRTAWSIVWGGISGGMPILAGRVLGIAALTGVAQIDLIGVLLSLGVLFWIPTHIMTFNMRYHDDYQTARVPTFPSAYSFQMTRVTIAASSLAAALTMGGAVFLIGTTFGYLRLLVVLSTALLLMAIYSVVRPSDRMNFGLFKYASIYMLSLMLLLILGAL
ncbi:MAG: heme o synthase [Spirochaetales bacterium]|nr:heme o synthase [Spirochaetales bacterium]